MSLLASKDVSTRDAMTMMAWESPEMIQVYEKMLEKARGDSDIRTMKLVNSINELNYNVPEVSIPTPKLKPTEIALRELILLYSNIGIGEIYGMSEAAIRKHLKKYGIVRAKRIESADISGDKIQEIREKLMEDI